jgi:hypothetical protein
MVSRLVADKYISDRIFVSLSWVRGERHKRRHSLPHILTIDPIMIGSIPRYRQDEVDEWMESLKPANDNFAVKNGGQA